MAEDGARRSARSTKGQHTKALDESPPQAKPTKGKKKQAQEEPEEPAEEIRCVCGIKDEDVELDFISCDRCEVWQHNVCMGITEDPKKLAKLKYLCERCSPDAHKGLLAAIERGDRPWEERNGQKSREKKGQKNGKVVKPSAPTKLESPSPASGGQAEEPKKSPEQPEDGGKRKRSLVEHDASPVAQPNKIRKGSQQTSEKKVGSQVNQYQAKTASNEPVTSMEPVKSIDQLSDKARKSITSDLKKRFVERIKEAAQQRLFRIPDEHTADSLGEDVALRVEHAILLTHGGKRYTDLGGTYKNQYITIRSNIPKNIDLVVGLANGSITPDVLSKMSAKDMASEEQRKRDELIQQENEKQAMLMKDEGAQHIRRTHKGEEVVDDSASHFKGDAISTVQVPRRRESAAEDEEDSDASPTTAHLPQDVDSTPFPSPGPPASATETNRSPPQRRQSSSFDIQDVWKSGGSPNGEPRPRPPQQPRQMNTNVSQPRNKAQQNHDADIDRLLAEDDYSAPYSPAELSSDMQTFWRGNVDMPIDKDSSIAKFRCGAHLIAGSDLSNRVALADIYPPKLEIHGRIPATSADQYLTSLSAARGLDVTVHNLVPDDNAKDQEQFDKLFEYLLARQRFGVVGEKTHQPNVRDVYIIPVEAGASKIPDFLDRLASNAIEQPRPQKLLLVVFVMKWQSNPLLSPSATAQPPRSSMSVGTPQAAPAMSPTSAGGPDAAKQLPHHLSQAQPNPRQSVPPGQLPSNPYEMQQQEAPPMSGTPQQLSLTQAQTDAVLKMRDILGESVNAPVTQILWNSDGLSFVQDEAKLLRLKKMYDVHPEARTDFNAFAHYLAQDVGRD
ncbi:MAG: hypothetical protein M1828_003914 [Chrysothrix sp. TS-e1954]|nr:MAG: hypothetical protein M1828_003914 [Chrysothrix sp. TS-e1954]